MGEPIDATDEELVEVEFLSADKNCEVRIRCFEAAQRSCSRNDFKEHLECAKQLYAWVMELGIEAPEEPSVIATEDQCERRH